MNRPMAKIAGCLLVLGALASLETQAQGAGPALNNRVLAYARSKMNQQVGNGECWTLAYEALKSAKAHLPGQNGYGTYVFGRKVALGSIRPGDILQFENVRFRHTAANGSWSETDFPHHTAIVAAVRGRNITILQQNYNHIRRVGKQTINLKDRQGGSLTAFRPQPK